jgi:hypothetical protein
MHEINIQYIIVIQLYLNLLKSGQVGFQVDWFQVISDFGLFGFGSGQILSRVISIVSDFGSFWFGSGRISSSLILGYPSSY